MRVDLYISSSFLDKNKSILLRILTATILMLLVFALMDESNREVMGETGDGPFFRLVLLFWIFSLGVYMFS